MAPDIKMNAGKQVGKEDASFVKGYVARVVERVCGKSLTHVSLEVSKGGDLPFIYFDYGFNIGDDKDRGYDTIGWYVTVPGAKSGFQESSNYDTITSAVASRYLKHVLSEEDYDAVFKTVFLATEKWNALTCMADVREDPDCFDDIIYGKDKVA